MPTTRTNKTVEKKPAATMARAQATGVGGEGPSTSMVRGSAPKETKISPPDAMEASLTKSAAKSATAKTPVKKIAEAKRAAAPLPPAPKETSLPKAAVETKAAPVSKAVVASRPPAAKKLSAPAPKGPRAPNWEPRPVPIHEIDGKAADPRLAAALAARERWHGRSGRPALKSATQAVAFVRERHLVHASVRSALPNLIDPIVGRICTDEERATGVIAQTLKSWRREIDVAPDVLEARLCFERPTLIGADLWPALLAVAAPREDAARRGTLLSAEAEEALDYLDRKGAVPAERLGQLIGLDPASFKRVHAELESRLLVVSRGDVDEDDNPITVVETLGLWAERAMPRKSDLEIGRAWCFLFIAALRSAVVLWPEEVEALFPWSSDERRSAISEAMTTGAVISYSEGGSVAWVASPVPR